MVYLLFGFGALLLIWALLRFALSAPPAVVIRILRRSAIVVLAVTGVALLAIGRFRLALLPGALLLALLLRWSPRRSRGSGPPAVTPGDADATVMTREQAAEILGVGPDAGREEIIAAHARQRALRDADGASRWATARLDRARDLLMGEGS